MTSEQIAEVRALTEQRAHYGEGIGVTKEQVLRLLDEREALLVAAREVVGDDRYSRALEAAIAKAEAP